MEDFSDDVRHHWVGSRVKILENPTSLEFLRDCVASYEPAIIRGVISDWPAIREWNLTRLCEILEGSASRDGIPRLLKVNITPDGLGDCVKNIAIGSQRTDSSAQDSCDGKMEPIFVYPLECMMPTTLFHEMMSTPHEGDVAPYLSLQNDNIRIEMPELLSDIAPSLKIAEDAFMQDQPEAVNLWVGDERSVSSTHKDHFENLYAVITGEKTFTLLPPTDVLYVEEKEVQTMQYELKKIQSGCKLDKSEEERSSEMSDRAQDFPILSKRLKRDDLGLTSLGCPSDSLSWITTDPDDPEVLIKHPKFKFAHPLRCKVQPGEILYIPAMWYHRVSQTRLTIAVNYWYDQKYDFRYCFCQSIKRLKDEMPDDSSERVP